MLSNSTSSCFARHPCYKIVLRFRLVHKASLRQPLWQDRQDRQVQNGVQLTLLPFPPPMGFLQSTSSCQVLCLQVCLFSVFCLEISVQVPRRGFAAVKTISVFVSAPLLAEYTTWRAVPSYYGAGRGTVTAVPHETQSEPIQFTKICRPTAYRASVRNGEVQKLVKLLAAASSDNCSIQGCGSLQQSSHSAFRMLKPQQAVEA